MSAERDTVTEIMMDETFHCYVVLMQDTGTNHLFHSWAEVTSWLKECYEQAPIMGNIMLAIFGFSNMDQVIAINPEGWMIAQWVSVEGIEDDV